MWESEDITQEGGLTSPTSLKGLSQTLEKLYANEIRNWWESTLLQCYLDGDRIPRGLAIYAVPSYENPDPMLLQEWAEHTTSSSKGMLQILNKYAINIRAKLLEEIKKIEDLIAQDTEIAAVETLR
ncbi:hypothetical protein NDU88_004340 [Pleurodeles waltl]|uniref:Uncharacterized protein n=1 Tax=Pleurodeles waltl TaxID=8319 RepID=A0AAV7NJF0_PLEWA|nr:hypothetical protein NDU88_004340 [Pleurodeles waltl]